MREHHQAIRSTAQFDLQPVQRRRISASVCSCWASNESWAGAMGWSEVLSSVWKGVVGCAVDQ